MTTHDSAETVSPWFIAAKDAEAAHAAASGRLRLLSAHGGAGASTWAQILGGIDATGALPPDMTLQQALDPALEHTLDGAGLVLVARASMVGIDAAKRLVGAHRLALGAVLIVPAAPGRTPRQLSQELRVLEGAIPTVLAPWVADLILKRPGQAAATDVPAKELARVSAELGIENPVAALAAAAPTSADRPAADPTPQSLEVSTERDPS